MIKGAKSIAEYKIREYLGKKEIDVEYFVFKMVGPQEAVIEDCVGDQMRLIYDPATRTVIEMDPGGEDAPGTMANRSGTSSMKEHRRERL